MDEVAGSAVSIEVVGRLDMVVICAFGWGSSARLIVTPSRSYDISRYPPNAHLLRHKVETAESVKLVADLTPQILNLLMLLLELLIPGVTRFPTRRSRLVLLLVNLRERFGRLRILQIEVPGGQERCRLVRPHTDCRIEVVLRTASATLPPTFFTLMNEVTDTHIQDTLFDELLEGTDRLLGDDRCDLLDVLKVEIFLQQRVFGPRSS